MMATMVHGNTYCTDNLSLKQVLSFHIVAKQRNTYPGSGASRQFVLPLCCLNCQLCLAVEIIVRPTVRSVVVASSPLLKSENAIRWVPFWGVSIRKTRL